MNNVSLFQGNVHQLLDENCPDNSISEIWNGEKYSSLRNSHLNGQRTKCYPCDRCPNGS